MSSDPRLRAKVRRIVKLEWFYRISPLWRLLLVGLLVLFFSESTGPITEWFLTREIVRSWTAFFPFVWAGPFILAPFFYAMWLTHQLKLATNPAVPLTQARLWRVSTWLWFNKILLVLELLSELGCIWIFSEGIFNVKPLSPVFLGFEISVSMIYLYYRVDSIRLVTRFVKELQQEQNSSRLQPTQIQEQNPNSVPPKQTSIAIPE